MKTRRGYALVLILLDKGKTYVLRSQYGPLLLEICLLTTMNMIYNPGKNIWNKIEKSNKTGQVKKSLICTFVCFWAAIAKV